jgi:xenotropic and polytropic retrovirus receptor 1
MCLSLYRIDRHFEYQVLFIFFGCLNSVYVSVWDLVMDWSLCNPYAPNPLLRTDLGFKSTKFYYAAMVIDPILRFNWLLYVILPADLQHSALLSFLLSVSEGLRRGMWTLIRVENEHCTNVGRFRASRDVPLPYELDYDKPLSPEAMDEPAYQPSIPPPSSASATGTNATTTLPQTPHTAATAQPTSSAIYQPSPQMLRRRQTLPAGALESGHLESPGRLMRVGTMLATAHAQDFERRKKPGGTFVGYKGAPEPNDPTNRAEEEGQSSDDEEEEPLAESARLIGDQRDDNRPERESPRNGPGEAAQKEHALSQQREDPGGSGPSRGEESPASGNALAGSSREEDGEAHSWQSNRESMTRLGS